MADTAYPIIFETLLDYLRFGDLEDPIKRGKQEM
jgi:hypothetical protein